MEDRIKGFSPEEMLEFVINATGADFEIVSFNVTWEGNDIVTEYKFANEIDVINLTSNVNLGRMRKPLGSVCFRGQHYIYNLDLRRALAESFEDNFRI